MNQQLRHEEMQEMLPAAGLGVLEGAELDQLRIHLGECPGCTALLRQYRDAAAGLALGAPARGFDPLRSAAVRGRLMARARANRGARTAPALRPDSWLGWMVAAGLAGVLLVHHSVHRTLNYGWFAAGLLAFVLAGLAYYARKQRRRVQELEGRQPFSETRHPRV